MGLRKLLLDLGALLGGGVVSGLDVGLALVAPLLVLRRGQGTDLGGHVRVVAPAQLGAVAGEDLPRELGGDLEPGVIRVAGDGVELAAQLGDPPGVRDVLGVDVERHRRLHRDDHLLVGEDRVQRRVGAVVGVGVAPDVLLAVDADVERAAVGRQLLGRPGGEERAAVGQLQAVRARVRRVADVVELEEREGGQDHEDERGADRPADLQPRVAADLGGDEPLARAELEQRVEEGPLDAEEDDHGDGEDQLVERVDLVGVRRAPALRRQRVGEGGAGEDQQRGQGDEDGEGEATRRTGGRGPGPGQGARIVFTGRRTTIRRWRAYRPSKTGGRFWMKAATPSAKSGELAISCWMSASSSSCSSMRVESQWLSWRLPPAYERVGPAASRSRSAATSLAKASSGTTRLTRPQSSACAAGMRPPSMAISAARASPTRVGTKSDEPPSGTRPMFTKASRR